MSASSYDAGDFPKGLAAFFMEQDALKKKLVLTTRTLSEAGIRYALIGGNAVAYYVGQVDPGAIRSTSDVDLLMNRGDLPLARTSLEAVGCRYRNADGIHMFMDTDSIRNAVHVLFAGEKVRSEYTLAAPTLDTVEEAPGGLCVVPLQRLVEMKLTSFRRKDQMHLDDMIDVGLLPGDIMASLPDELRARLQELLDHPE